MTKNGRAYFETTHNVYTIKHTEIEKGDPDCKEKKRFEKYLNAYTNNLWVVNTNITIYEEMLKPQYQKMDIICPIFFTYSQYSCIYTAIIILSAFLSKDSAGLYKFRNYIEANYTKIFTKDFYDEVIGFPNSKKKINSGTFNDILCQFDSKLNQTENLISRIKTTRDKVYAHFEKDVMIMNKTDFNCTLQDLKDAATLIAELINIFAVYYNRKLISSDIAEQRDIQNLLKYIPDIPSNSSE